MREPISRVMRVMAALAAIACVLVSIDVWRGVLDVVDRVFITGALGLMALRAAFEAIFGDEP